MSMPRNTSMVLMAISDIVSHHLHCAGMMKVHRNKVSRIEQLSVETVQPELEDEVGVHRHLWWRCLDKMFLEWTFMMTEKIHIVDLRIFKCM